MPSFEVDELWERAIGWRVWKRFYHAFWMANVARSVRASLQIAETQNPLSWKQIHHNTAGRTKNRTF